MRRVSLTLSCFLCLCSLTALCTLLLPTPAIAQGSLEYRKPTVDSDPGVSNCYISGSPVDLGPMANAYDGSTPSTATSSTATVTGGSGVPIKGCRDFYGFPAASTTYAGVTLTVTGSYNIPAGTAGGQVVLLYSTQGGNGWQGQLFSLMQGSYSGSWTASLPVGQDPTKVRLRLMIVGGASTSGVAAGSATISISDIYVSGTIPSPSTTTLSSSSNPIAANAPVTFTATLTSGATGTVTFKDGTTTLGSSTASGGVATFSTSSLTIGSHSITAIYGGDSNYTGSTSAVLQQQIVSGTPSTTGLVVAPNSSTYGAPVTFTASVTSGAAGNVTFKNGNSVIGTSPVVGGTAVFQTSSLAVGTYSVTAVYSGDANYAGSSSGSAQLVVNKAPVSLAISSSANPAIFLQSVTFTCTATSGGVQVTGPYGSIVLFRLDGQATSLASSLSTSGLDAGTHTVACEVGDSNYAGTTVSLVQTVNKGGTEPVISAMSPTTGPSGTLVRLTGSEFGATRGNNNVTFGGVAGDIVYWSDATILVRVPNGVPPGSVDVRVASSSPATFVVVQSGVCTATAIPWSLPWVEREVKALPSANTLGYQKVCLQSPVMGPLFRNS